MSAKTLDSYTLAELIAMYTECLRSLIGADSFYRGADAGILETIKAARSARLALIGAAVDVKSTSLVHDVYRPMAS